MAAPLCARCGDGADFALLRPSAVVCTSIEFACTLCVRDRRGYAVALADVAALLPALGGDARTRRAAALLAVALVDASSAGRARLAEKAQSQKSARRWALAQQEAARAA